MTLLTSPELEMTYYCDTAGRVPEVAECVTGFRGLEVADVGNGDLSPEWGVDLVVRGGAITYGPWADRQRLVSVTQFHSMIIANKVFSFFFLFFSR